MPEYKHNEKSFSLFENARKTRETHPDVTGQIMINGVLYKLWGYYKVSEKGILM